MELGVDLDLVQQPLPEALEEGHALHLAALLPPEYRGVYRDRLDATHPAQDGENTVLADRS